MDLHCPHCSEQIEAALGDEFCPECGQPIKAALEAALAGTSLAHPQSTGTTPEAHLQSTGTTPEAPPTSTPVLLIKVDGRPPVRFTGAPILVGRLDEANGSIPDLPFNDPAISRRHLTVWQEGAKILVQDGSTNGTFRAGLRLPQGAPVELQAGEALTLPGQMGTYTIRFEFS
ncbi:MAG TPA: FHA domain-containing protein [Symbiobacteriaceae bacterium]|nr:FHA domain-containing protein [Symbiobacteriaceae bacterium]